MNKRNEQFLTLYLENRHKDQAIYYKNRYREFDKARNQAIIFSGILMFLASIVSFMTTSQLFGAKWMWAVLGVLLPALSTALASYSSLLSFDQQSKLYRDAQFALHKFEANAVELQQVDDDAGFETGLAAYVNQVEGILRSEQGQWGQLISQLKLPEAPAKREVEAKAPDGESKTGTATETTGTEQG